jgi:outer membrane usher protein
MTLTYKDKPLPFGAMVTVGEHTGIVGDDGLAYMSGMPAEGTAHIVWGEGAERQCIAPWRLPADTENLSVVKISAVCS